jgi:hypothetical protein
MLKFVAMAEQRKYNYEVGGQFDIGFGYGSQAATTPIGAYGTGSSAISAGSGAAGGGGGGLGFNPITGMYTDPTTGTPQSTGISAAGGVAGFVGGVFDAFNARKRLAQGKRDSAAAQMMVNQKYDQLGDVKETISSATTDAFEMGSRTKSNINPILQNQATLASALEGGGTRALLSRLDSLDTTDAIQQVKDADLARDIASTQAYGQVQQSVDSANKANQRNILSDQLTGAKTALATAEQNVAQAKADKTDAAKNIATGAIETGLSFIDPTKLFGENGMKMPLYEKGGKTPFGMLSVKHGIDNNPNPTQADRIAGATAEEGMMYMRGGSVMNDIMRHGGGMPPVQGPMPGPASHDTNPMHVVDNNGEKQAELMGEEFIIRRDMAQDMSDGMSMIKEQLESGEQPSQEDWMKFYDTMAGVLGLPQFQDNLA